jgi:hypothetical protein
MHDHDDSADHGTGNKIVSFNWMQPRHGGFLVLDDAGAPVKAFSSYFEMEHDFNMQMRQEAGIVAPDSERMPNFVSEQNPKATALTDDVRTQPPRWNLGNSIVNLAARASR